MTTISFSQPRPIGRGFFFLLMAALVMAAIFFSGFDMGSFKHAGDKHPGDADQVRECLKNGGAQWLGWNRADKKYAFACRLPDGRWGFRALGTDSNGIWFQKTSFIVDDTNSLSDIIDYLKSTGYTKTTTLQGLGGSPAQLYQALIDAGVFP